MTRTVPPSAASNSPCVSTAPVNAPFLCPKSSDSISSPGIAAQLTATNARAASGPESWMAWATSSLPVPDSPAIITVTRVRAAASMRS